MGHQTPCCLTRSPLGESVFLPLKLDQENWKQEKCEEVSKRPGNTSHYRGPPSGREAPGVGGSVFRGACLPASILRADVELRCYGGGWRELEQVRRSCGWMGRGLEGSQVREGVSNWILCCCFSGRPKCCSLHLGILPLIVLALVFFSYGFVSHRSQELGDSEAETRMVYAQPKVLTPSRNDVLVLTPWLAPIIWEGTFNIDILNEQFRLQNTTVGLTVFAIKKYVVFLKLFLETAEQHFMVGHKVTYYVFTDRPADVPQVPLGAGRKLVVLTVRNYTRWQDVSMHRMEMISRFSEQRFLHEVDYLVCADVDMKFSDHVGVEILSALFGTLHPGFYSSSREAFTYERRPKSQAYIPRDEGDFYYMGAFFGGSVVEVHRLTKACHQAMVKDKANGIEAVWHDESHLNKYLLYHKPTKVLSPEYMWDQKLLGWPSVMKKLRYVAVPKNHQAIRNR
ncbi:histo-blood group ABO system transferase isoform X1 [Cricetulus griseus]|uniref:histo-blood group ABO system transferase isoform X1 n=1 Tax=Cricetulus griseus TaxID=10029 RepID=UPI0015C39ADF|nr:histo-blood group ABO system transferase isoform X1 [Cricetulus griseus]